jgi:hypothetical protein
VWTPSFGAQPEPVGISNAQGPRYGGAASFKEAPMSLVSDSRKCAQDWFDLAEHLPLKERQAALEIAEAWFQFAMDAAALNTGQTHALAANPHNIH